MTVDELRDRLEYLPGSAKVKIIIQDIEQFPLESLRLHELSWELHLVSLAAAEPLDSEES